MRIDPALKRRCVEAASWHGNNRNYNRATQIWTGRLKIHPPYLDALYYAETSTRGCVRLAGISESAFVPSRQKLVQGRAEKKSSPRCRIQVKKWLRRERCNKGLACTASNITLSLTRPKQCAEMHLGAENSLKMVMADERCSGHAKM